MSSSLVYDTVGELLPSNPRLPGVHLLLNYDLGEAETVTSQVESLLLDGERVIASRASNRTIVLPLIVIGSDRSNLTARVDALLRKVQAEGATLTWTPDGGLPLVWDCFVGHAVPRWDVRIENVGFSQQVDVTIPALPFGRSPASATVTTTAVQTETRGVVYDLAAIIGSARSPVACEIGFASAVSAWLLHHPPTDADPAAPILTPVVGPSVTVPNAHRLRGTYSVVLGISSYGTAGQTRTMTLTFHQSGTSYTQTIKRTYVSSANLRPLVVGNITLPLIDRPAGASVTLTVDVSDSGGTTVVALMLLDSRGQTVMSMSQPAGVADTVTAWVDEPDLTAATGKVWNGTGAARTTAFAVADPRLSGGPVAVSADDNGTRMLVFGAEANANALAVTYSPRWLAERVA